MESESGLQGPPVVEAEPVEPAAVPRLPSRVEELLAERPGAFSFFQAVRLLERIRPDRSRVGGWGDPAEEVVRFSVPPHFGFPTAEIRDLRFGEDPEDPARMSVSFMGLTGPTGVLPHEYTRLLASRLRARDRAPAEFLDLFHHRLISLFYLAWRKNRFDLHVESPPDEGGFVRHLLDLLGLGLDEFQGRQEVPDDTLVYYSGLLAPQARSAAALRQLLEDRLGVPVEVEEFVGGWFPLPERDRCHLGEDDGSTVLGGGAVVGDEIWDQQSKVRLRLGPLDRETFRRFLPGGADHRELRSLVRFFSHDQFEFEVQLILRGEEVPGTVLGDEGSEDRPLGWCTWLRSAPRDHDADETILSL